VQACFQSNKKTVKRGIQSNSQNIWLRNRNNRRNRLFDIFILDLDKTMTNIFALRTTANREDQVMDFIVSKIKKDNLNVYSVLRGHGMRGYIFLEAENQQDANECFAGVPYARGLLREPVPIQEIAPMLEQTKVAMNIEKGDIVEIISGPFKRESARVTRIDEQKEEVIVELLEAAVPIPITVKLDSVRVIRRDTEEEEK